MTAKHQRSLESKKAPVFLALATFILFAPSGFAIKQSEKHGITGLAWRCSAKSEYPVTTKVPLGTPARDAGIESNSLLISIEGHDTRYLGDSGCTRLLAGLPGTKVTVSLRSPSGTNEKLVLTRKSIEDISYQSTKRTYKISFQHEDELFGKNDFEVPYLVKGKLLTNPVVLFFYDPKKKLVKLPESLLVAVRNPFSKTLVPRAVALYYPVNSSIGKFFKIKSAPSYVFIGIPNQVIQEKLDVVRKKLKIKELKDRLDGIKIDFNLQKRNTRLHGIIQTKPSHWHIQDITRPTEDAETRRRLKQKLIK